MQPSCPEKTCHGIDIKVFRHPCPRVPWSSGPTSVSGMITPGNLFLALGDIGNSILKTVALGPANVETIHLMTGLPKSCIKGRIPFLKDIRFIEETSDGYVLTPEGLDYLSNV